MEQKKIYFVVKNNRYMSKDKKFDIESIGDEKMWICDKQEDAEKMAKDQDGDWRSYLARPEIKR